jgi:hypothetical protein
MTILPSLLSISLSSTSAPSFDTANSGENFAQGSFMARGGLVEEEDEESRLGRQDRQDRHTLLLDDEEVGGKEGHASAGGVATGVPTALLLHAHAGILCNLLHTTGVWTLYDVYLWELMSQATGGQSLIIYGIYLLTGLTALISSGSLENEAGLRATTPIQGSTSFNHPPPPPASPGVAAAATAGPAAAGRAWVGRRGAGAAARRIGSSAGQGKLCRFSTRLPIGPRRTQ